MPARMQWPLAALCGLLLMAGCSMVRLGYSQADTYAAWTANEYFDIDARQKDAFLSRFTRLHAWHRHEQLPEYASFLESAKLRLQHDLQREDILWFLEGLKERYRRIVNHGVSDAAEILATLTPSQLDALQRQWIKDNRKFAREYQLEEIPQEQRRARAQRMLSIIRDWAGSLSDEQERKIIAYSYQLPLAEHLRHADRLRRQREFLHLLNLRGNLQEFTPRLRRWLLDWEAGRSPEFELQYTRWQDQRMQFMIDVYGLLTAPQRGRLQQRLQGYIDDFRQLSADGERTAAR